MTHGREQSRAGRVRVLARQYSTTTFFLLTFLITWALWVPRVLAPESVAATLALFGTYGPAIAAVIVGALVGKFRDLGTRLVRWRVGWQWYAVVLLFTLSAMEADTPVLVVVLLKWLLAAAVAASWLLRARAARVTNRPLAGAL
jgi:hypothetical protein